MNVLLLSEGPLYAAKAQDPPLQVRLMQYNEEVGSTLAGKAARVLHGASTALQVPAQVVGPGVLRCRVPPHSAGAVGVCVTAGDGRPCSKTVTFEYRLIPEVARPQRNER